jgi:hypothetical protein
MTMNIKHMNPLNQMARRLGLASLMILVVACSGGGGGGGGDTNVGPTNPINTPTTPSGYTQAQAKTTANLGFLSSELIFNRIQDESSGFAYFAQGFISNGVLRTPGQYSNTISCASSGSGSGTLSVVMTVTGNAGDTARAGLLQGDTINLDYSSCDFGGTGVVKNGNAVITSLGTYSTLGSVSPTIADFQFKYNLTTNNFNVVSGTIQRILSNGSQDIDFTSSADASSLTITSKVTATSMASYFRPVSASLPTSANKLDLGSTYSSQRNFSTGSLELQLDGSASFGTESASLPFVINTPVKLIGNVTSGRLIPAAGTMRAKDVTANLLTQTTWSGGPVAVSADTNKDNSLDLNFSFASHGLFIAP